MDSMYKGKTPFSREQSIFVVEAILCSVLDRIESGLPSCIDWKDRKDYANRIDNDPLSMSAYDRGAMEAAGMALGVFYAQLSDDGLGIYDALACASVNDVDFPTACERLISESWADKGKRIKKRLKINNTTLEKAYGDLWPNTRLYAESFVDAIFEFDAEGNMIEVQRGYHNRPAEIDESDPPPPGHGVTIESAVDAGCGADGFVVINEGGDILDETPRSREEAIRVAWLRVKAADVEVVRVALDGNNVHYWPWYQGEEDYSGVELDADVANYAMTKLKARIELATVDPVGDPHSHYEIMMDLPNGQTTTSITLSEI